MRWDSHPVVLSRFTMVAAAFLLIAGLSVAAVGADPKTEKEHEANGGVVETEPLTASSAGRVVHIDPQSGRKIQPSPAQRAAARAHLSTLINRSAVGLVETASPQSGIMVNLQGRFRHTTAITVDELSESTALCTATLPEEAKPQETNHE